MPKHILKKVSVVPAKVIDDVWSVALETFPPPAPAPTGEKTAKAKTPPRRGVGGPRREIVAGAKS